MHGHGCPCSEQARLLRTLSLWDAVSLGLCLGLQVVKNFDGVNLASDVAGLV